MVSVLGLVQWNNAAVKRVHGLLRPYISATVSPTPMMWPLRFFFHTLSIQFVGTVRR